MSDFWIPAFAGMTEGLGLHSVIVHTFHVVMLSSVRDVSFTRTGAPYGETIQGYCRETRRWVCVAHSLGLKGVVVGQGNPYEEALVDAVGHHISP